MNVGYGPQYQDLIVCGEVWLWVLENCCIPVETMKLRLISTVFSYPLCKQKFIAFSGIYRIVLEIHPTPFITSIFATPLFTYSYTVHSCIHIWIYST